MIPGIVASSIVTDVGYRYFVLSITAAQLGSSNCAIYELALFVGATQYPTSAMTGYSAPSPYVCGANGEGSPSASPAWRAFNRVTTDRWLSGVGVLFDLYIDVGALISLTSFSVTASGTSSPKNFTLYGGASYASKDTALKAVSGQTGWALDTRNYVL